MEKHKAFTLSTKSPNRPSTSPSFAAIAIVDYLRVFQKHFMWMNVCVCEGMSVSKKYCCNYLYAPPPAHIFKKIVLIYV